MPKWVFVILLLAQTHFAPSSACKVSLPNGLGRLPASPSDSVATPQFGTRLVADVSKVIYEHFAGPIN